MDTVLAGNGPSAIQREQKVLNLTTVLKLSITSPYQRGFATSFAKKVINSKFYCRGLIQNSPVAFGPVIG